MEQTAHLVNKKMGTVTWKTIEEAEKFVGKLEQLREDVASGKFMTSDQECTIVCSECPLCDEEHKPDLCDILDNESCVISITPAIEAIKKVALEKIDAAIAKTQEKSKADKDNDAALLESIQHWGENLSEARDLRRRIANVHIHARDCALCKLHRHHETDMLECECCVLPPCGKPDTAWKQVVTKQREATRSILDYEDAVCTMYQMLLDVAEKRALKV